MFILTGNSQTVAVHKHHEMLPLMVMGASYSTEQVNVHLIGGNKLLPHHQDFEIVSPTELRWGGMLFRFSQQQGCGRYYEQVCN